MQLCAEWMAVLTATLCSSAAGLRRLELTTHIHLPAWHSNLCCTDDGVELIQADCVPGLRGALETYTTDCQAISWSLPLLAPEGRPLACSSRRSTPYRVALASRSGAPTGTSWRKTTLLTAARYCELEKVCKVMLMLAKPSASSRGVKAQAQGARACCWHSRPPGLAHCCALHELPTPQPHCQQDVQWRISTYTRASYQRQLARAGSFPCTTCACVCHSDCWHRSQEASTKLPEPVS